MSRKSIPFFKIWVIVLLAVLLLFGVWVFRAMRTPDDEIPFEENVIQPTERISAECAAAYNDVIAQYRAVLQLSELDWQDNAAEQVENYPLVNPAYVGFYHMGMVNTLYATTYDLDGNGTDELFIGLGDRRDATEVGVYAFDGEKAVTLSLTDTQDGYQILSDGLFLRGDKSGTVLAVKRIAEDGYCLIDTDADIRPGDDMTDADFSAHGDNLYVENWQKVALQ